jgi:hypothetical protein
MWIASFHWLASIGTMVRAGNSPWTSGRESAWSKIDLQMAVKNEFTFAVSNEFIFSASNEFIFVVGAEIALVGSCDEELAVLGHSLSKHPQEKAARAAAVSESDQWPSALCRSKQSPQNKNRHSVHIKRCRGQNSSSQQWQDSSADNAHTGQACPP